MILTQKLSTHSLTHYSPRRTVRNNFNMQEITYKFRNGSLRAQTMLQPTKIFPPLEAEVEILTQV